MRDKNKQQYNQDGGSNARGFASEQDDKNMNQQTSQQQNSSGSWETKEQGSKENK